MSKIIEFNPRDYRFDPSCQGNNVGECVFITTDLGTKEVWEIGDWGWNWTQIFREMALEKNTDYTLRFAVSGGYCDTWDSVSKVWIYHTDGYDTLEAAWEDKMAFPLDNDRFAPIISKKDRTGIIRVFEIPFNTENFENWRITFVAHHAVARFMSAGEYSAYEKLKSLTLEELKNSGSRRAGKGIRIDLSRACLTEKALSMILAYAEEGYIIDLSETAIMGDNDTSAVCSDNSRKECSETEFAGMINSIGNGSVKRFENITVNPNASLDEKLVIGESADGAVLEFSNVMLTSLMMSAIIAKLGNGCVVTFSDINVSPYGLDAMIITENKPDGVVIEFSNAIIPEKAMKLLKEKMGDGCCVSTDNVTAYCV